MKKYRIYIDETGNSDLASSDNPNHRYLSLSGVIFDLQYVENKLHPDMENIKKQFFHSHPDEPIIFHRKEMVKYKHPFESLKDPSIKNNFNKILLQKFQEWEYVLITVLIDKKEHNEMYNTWKFDPYHYCLSVLLERYIAFLEDHNSIGDVMIESRGGKEDIRLKHSFNKLYENGTTYIEADRFKKFITSKQLKVKPKNYNIAGLQVADLLAHPSRRDILIQLGINESDSRVFGDKIIQVIQNKYYIRKGKLWGYGIKKLP